MKTLVLINRKADMGKAGAKWSCVAPRLAGLLGPHPTVCDETHDWSALVGERSGDGDALVVAGGGDGTVHRVANLLLEQAEDARPAPILGAIGLGSSNDFHKPFRKRPPLRCSPRRVLRQNVLRVRHQDEDGRWHDEHVVANCSVGAVALGNAMYNRAAGLVGLCRRLSPDVGSWAASLVAPLCQRAMFVRLTVDGVLTYEGQTDFVGVYVNRHFSGSLAYDDRTDVFAPTMGVTLAPSVGLRERLRLLARTAKAGMPGPPHTKRWSATRCHLVFHRLTFLEMDGEVTTTMEASIRLLPRALRVCR